MTHTLNEIEIDGVKYEARDEVNDCADCAFNEDIDLCLKSADVYSCSNDLRSDDRNVIWVKKEQTAVPKEVTVGKEIKMFDMTQTKVGDKLLTRGGEVVTLVNIDNRHGVRYPYELDNDITVTYFGYGWSNRTETRWDIVGFATARPTQQVTANKGVKSDQGKTQWSYLPIPAVKAVVDVMAYGDTKYPAPDGSNWKRVPDAKKRYYNAAMRHLTAWWDGEQNDPETGYNHLAHACSNLLFLLWFEIKGYPETE